MSFDSILTLCTMIFCFFVLKISLTAQKEAFRQGFTAGKLGEPEKIVEKPKKNPKTPEETDEVKRLNALLANIDAYDGTGLGQKEIK